MKPSKKLSSSPSDLADMSEHKTTLQAVVAQADEELAATAAARGGNEDAEAVVSELLARSDLALDAHQRQEWRASLVILVRRFPTVDHGTLVTALSAADGHVWSAFGSMQNLSVATSRARAEKQSSASESLGEAAQQRWLVDEVKNLKDVGAIQSKESVDTKMRVERLKAKYQSFDHAIVVGALRLESGDSAAAAQRLQALQDALKRAAESGDGGSCVCS